MSETQWQPIETYSSHLGVLVSRPTDRVMYGPYAAFKDVTGVWRILGSEGGMDELGFTPTHWMPLPPVPAPPPHPTA